MQWNFFTQLQLISLPNWHTGTFKTVSKAKVSNDLAENWQGVNTQKYFCKVGKNDFKIISTEKAYTYVPNAL